MATHSKTTHGKSAGKSAKKGRNRGLVITKVMAPKRKFKGAVISSAAIKVGDIFGVMAGRLTVTNQKKVVDALNRKRVWDAFALLAADVKPEAHGPSAVISAALAKGAQRKLDLAEEAGGLLQSKAVAEMLGISPQAVHKRYSEDKLVAVPAAGGDLGYPAMQFQSDIVTDGLAKVLKQIGIKDQWMRLNWLLTKLSDLGGVTPIDAVKQGRVDEVARAAAAYGEHGAS